MMKKLIALAFAGLLSVFAATPALAGTNCTAVTITGVATEVFSGVAHAYITTDVGVAIDVPNTTVNYKEILSSAWIALTVGLPVDVSFIASGVSCSTFTYRTDLDTFFLK